MTLDRLLSRLYIGDARDACDVDALKERGITAVVCVAEELEREEDFVFAGERARPPGGNGIERQHFPLHDRDPARLSPEGARRAVEAYRASVTAVVDRVRGGETVLVHCQYGVSRSTTVCVGAVRQLASLSWNDALVRVTDAHPDGRMLNLDLMGYMMDRSGL